MSLDVVYEVVVSVARISSDSPGEEAQSVFLQHTFICSLASMWKASSSSVGISWESLPCLHWTVRKSKHINSGIAEQCFLGI